VIGKALDPLERGERGDSAAAQPSMRTANQKERLIMIRLLIRLF
jgi:hypothetical protein